jgi:hypothetical protein
MALKASVEYDTKELVKKIRALRDEDIDSDDDWPTKEELEKAGRDDNTQKIHELELHDKWWIEGYEVLRVPGGWIYDRKNAAVFVPYNDEGSKNIKL